MNDISIILPSIRMATLDKVCHSIKRACSRHTYEIIIISPYNLPEKLDYNIKYIKSYASPTCCIQMGSLLCASQYWFDFADDALLEENILSDAIDYYEQNNLQQYDILSINLKEGTLDPNTLEPLPNFTTHSLHPGFFDIKYNPPFWKPCINRNWKLALNFIIQTKTFIDIGGFDANSFEFHNWALHDIVLRLQSIGGHVITYPVNGLYVSHRPEETDDHGPVHNSQIGPDTDKFNEIYDNLIDIKNRAFININNWKNNQYAQWWSRRFG